MMSILLFKIGFLPISIWDVLDIIIVGFLFYKIYQLLRGSIAFNILLGVLLLTSAGWLMRFLRMDLSSLIISRIVNIGFIALIIIFQPEIRRFLVYLGQTTLRGRFDFINKYLKTEIETETTAEQKAQIGLITKAVFRLKAKRWGALIIIGNKNNVEDIAKTGQIINANISQELLLSIFNTNSPLHDGAVLIHNNKIHAASCILPLSQNKALPQKFGLRHRAGIGLSENSNMSVIIVSEESGLITFAKNGKYQVIKTEDDLLARLSSEY